MTEDVSGRSNRITAVLKLILLAVILVGIPAFLYFRYGSEVFSKEAVSDMVGFLRANRHFAWLLIIGIQIIQVVICVLPGQPVQFASSYMFGVAAGFALSLIGAVIGTVISFFLAKVLGRDALSLFFDREKLEDYRNKLNTGKGLMLAFLIYLIPGIPKDLVSYAAGISDMRFLPFLIVATVGRSPGMLGSLLLGHYFGRQNFRAIVILSVITALILLICYIFRRKLTGFLDELEAKDREREAKHNG